MTIQNISNFSIGFGNSSSLASNWAKLSEYKAGKIHLLSETLTRLVLVDNSLTFTRMVLEKLSHNRVVNQLQSNPIKWTIRLMPIALGYWKYQTEKTHPLLAKSLSFLESCMEKSIYAISVISSTVLIHFGHSLVGYSGLSVLLFNQIISNEFAKSRISLVDKVDAIFKTYIAPIAEVVAVTISGSYLAIGYSFCGLALMTHASFTSTAYRVQKNQIQDYSSNRLTLGKWNLFNTNGNKIYLEINKKRSPKINYPQLKETIDAKESILCILRTLPERLQKCLIHRIHNIPKEGKIQTFDHALKIAEIYLDELISFTKQRSDSIWMALLQQSCVLLQETNNLDQQLSGIIELLFGNEGQCQIAQQRNILSGFLTLSKTKDSATHALELKFNLALENVNSETCRSFLQAIFEARFPIQWEDSLQNQVISSNFFLRPFVKISLLFYQTLRKLYDLTDVHNYQLYEKFYGSSFGIKPITTDLIAESTNAEMLSSPLSYLVIKNAFTFNLKQGPTLEEASTMYFETQLQKILLWFSNQITYNQYFSPNEITLWFSHWIEKQDLPQEKTMELQDELINLGTIAGYPIYDPLSNCIAPTALIAFLYQMDVFTDSSETSLSVQDLIEDIGKTYDSVKRNLEKVGLSINILLEDNLPTEANPWINKLQLHELNKLSPQTRLKLKKYLLNLRNLDNLNLSSDMLFV